MTYQPPSRLGRETVMEEQRRNRKKELAKGRLNQAFNAKVNGELDKALVALADAVRTDPDLVTDAGALGLAQALTNLPRDQAIVMLLQRSREAIAESNTPNFALPSDALDIALEIVALVVIFLVFSAMFNVVILKAATNLMDRLALGTVVSIPIRNVVAQIRPVDVLWGTAKSGVLWVFSTMMGIFAMYLVGTFIGGAGSLSTFVRALVQVYILLVMLLIIGLIVSMLAILGYDANPALASNISFIGAWIVLFTIPIGFLRLAWAVSRSHKFGAIKGFVSVLLGNIILVILAAVFGLFAG